MLRTMFTRIKPLVKKLPPHAAQSRPLVAVHKNTAPPKLTRVTKMVRPEPSVSEKLKKAEDQFFSHKKRKRSQFHANRSAALALPYVNSSLEDLSILEALELAEKNVIEHANRRVDLFFYTLIAYYKKEAVPILGHTVLQHGVGRVAKTGHGTTQACHSSFTPSLIDKTICEDAGKKSKNILSGTHFLDSLNATVELPAVANVFDDLLEELCRQPCLNILGEVSQGEIDPIQGLNRFLLMMRNTLRELQRTAAYQNSNPLLKYSYLDRQQLNSKLVTWVARGTLRTTFDIKLLCARDEYIQLLLRMSPKEIELCGDDMQKGKLYLQKIAEIQDEILNSNQKTEPRP